MEELKVGDRVEHHFYGSGIIVETGLILGGDPFSIDLANVYFDTGAVLDIDVETLRKSTTKSPIKPKVKRWRWVLQNTPFYCPKNLQKTLWITPEHWTQEEIEQTAKKHKLEVIEKLDSTEKEFDD